jgi:SAM-dependent methyltransferase
MSPFSNAFLSSKNLSEMEAFFPLEVFVCPACWFVQLDAFTPPENIFTDYVYFSSYSQSWLEHAEKYAQMMIEKLQLSESSKVVEIASNDGYLLQYFAKKGIPVLGVEPAKNVAEIAFKERGIRSVTKFFGKNVAQEILKAEGPARLIAANNVLAHVPDINDFVSGFSVLLDDQGVVTFEFPHLLQMIQNNQFDTIYHEHFSYLSVVALKPLFERHGLEIFDIDEIPTHGGSLRIYLKHQANKKRAISSNVEAVLNKELKFGLGEMKVYEKFNEAVVNVKRKLLTFLLQAKESGKKVIGYGAAAKGNTLLNFCGIREDFIDFVSDKNPHKQNKFLPGTHIPVRDLQSLMSAKPDYVLILPWNLRNEIEKELSGIRSWGGKFVVAIPQVEVF